MPISIIIHHYRQLTISFPSFFFISVLHVDDGCWRCWLYVPVQLDHRRKKSMGRKPHYWWCPEDFWINQHRLSTSLMEFWSYEFEHIFPGNKIYTPWNICWAEAHINFYCYLFIFADLNLTQRIYILCSREALDSIQKT